MGLFSGHSSAVYLQGCFPYFKEVQGPTMSFVDSGCQKRDGFLRKAHQTTQENDWSSFKRQRSRISSFVKKNVKADIIEIFLKIVLPLQIYFGQPPRNSILLYWVDWVVSIPFSMPSFSSNSCNCRDNHIIYWIGSGSECFKDGKLCTSRKSFVTKFPTIILATTFDSTRKVL